MKYDSLNKDIWQKRLLLLLPPIFNEDTNEMFVLWRIDEGLYPPITIFHRLILWPPRNSTCIDQTGLFIQCYVLLSPVNRGIWDGARVVGQLLISIISSNNCCQRSSVREKCEKSLLVRVNMSQFSVMVRTARLASR